MKKFIFIFILILVLPMMNLIILSHQDYQHYLTTADSGFDSDYGDYDDGGSWGNDYGGSSWDNDYKSNNNNNSSYSGEPADLETVLLALFLCSIPISIIIIIKVCANNYNKKKAKEKHINDILLYDFGLYPGDGQHSEQVQTAYSNYVEIQKAWMNRDLSPVRHLLTDEIYNMYQMQIETLLEDNQINVMSNFEFVCGNIHSIKTSKNVETIKVVLCVRCKDYIKVANKNKIVSGDKNATITYIYELTFIKDIKSDNTINCPTCGALVKKQMSATCPYCNNSLLLTSSNLTMSNKTILYQFKR